MINHTRFDAFVFLLCDQLTARWRNSSSKSALCGDTWILKLKPHINSSGCSVCNTLILYYFFYWMFWSIKPVFLSFFVPLPGQ